MSRKFLPLALAACAMLAVSAPVASAMKAKASDTHSQIKTLQHKVGTLEDLSSGFQAAFTRNDGAIAGLASQVSTIVAGVPAIVNALTAINAALTNSTTGLVGLNLARPQFGAFLPAGTIQGGTGQVTGASGPKTNATKGPAGAASSYVVDFGNDVSKRMYTVDVFPYGPAALGGAGTTPYGSAANCSSNASYSAICAFVETGSPASPDTSPNHVLVQIGDGNTPLGTGFSVTAISG